MKRKPKFDYVRMEKEPPRVPAPWSVEGKKAPFTLMRNGIAIMVCMAMSEDGAHREGMFFIKEMDF